VLLAATAAVLERIADSRDLTVAWPMPGAAAPAVSPGGDLLPVRLRGPWEGTFREHLVATRDAVGAAQAHANVPFDDLVDALALHGDPAHAPICQLQVAAADPLPLRLAGIDVLPIDDATFPSRCDLAVQLSGNRLALRYGPLFERATAARMLGWLTTLLAAAVLAPDHPLQDLPLLPTEEATRLAVAWNATRSEYPRDASVPTLFSLQAAATPDAVALELGATRLTYAELETRSNRLAHHLIGLGVQPGELVGLCAGRSIELVVAILGILKAGAAYAPLDPGYPPERLGLMIQDTRARVILASADAARILPAEGSTILLLEELAALTAKAPSGAAPALAGPTDLAYVMYTSGSTGLPKGVAVPHRAIVRLVRGSTFISFSRDEVFLLLAPISFDASTLELWGPLLNGGRLVLMPGDKPALEDIGRVLRTHGVTTLWLTAGLFALMVDERLSDLAPVRQLLSGGDVLSVPHCERVLRELPGTRLINGYGPTENTTFSTTHAITSVAPGRSIPIGRPISNSTVYVVDARMRLLPTGVPGDLFLGGDGLALGYLRRPELDAERFVPNPFGEGRLYRTGDRARWLPDATLEFLGRRDGQVKLRGYRIELGEIEDALRRHPAVREVAVAVREPTPGDKRLVAYIVPAQTAISLALNGDFGTLTGELRSFAAEKLPGFMIPSAWQSIDALPLGPTGKVDKSALPALPVAAVSTATDVAPRSEIERTVQDVWQRVLKVAAVGLHENFFEIGGNSLLLVAAHAKLQSAFSVELPIVRLFQATTIASVAVLVASRLGGASESPAGGTRKARRTSTPTQGIAIVGWSGRFPGARSVDQLWANLLAGRETIHHFTAEELEARDPAALRHDPAYVRARGLLDDVELWDAAYFGYIPKEAELIDPQQRFFLECCSDALEDAGHDPARERGSIGVWAGQSLPTYLLANLAKDRSLLDRIAGEYQVGSYPVILGNDKDYLATRVAYKLDLSGPAMTVQTACSSSLVAVTQACWALQAGHCDFALAGGVSITFPQKRGYLHQEGGMVSEDGHCRSFDAGANGTVFSSGCGVVLLRPVEDALADGDHIYAVIKAAALNNDGSAKVGFMAPSPDRQGEVIASAHAQAGISARAVGYVETHGTGTPLGDPIEFEGLLNAFRETTTASGFCALGALKTNTGHMEVAAGVSGLIKAALVVREGVIPPTLHYQRPNPKIRFEGSPFYVPTRVMPFPADATPRRAGVSAFGVGGTNAHVIVEEPPAQADATGAWPEQLLVLSARTVTALDAASARLADHLESNPTLDLASAAWTMQIGRRVHAQRRALVARSREEAIALLRGKDPRRVWSGVSRSSPRIAFMFPGQGAQHPAMGTELYALAPMFRAEIDRACETLKPHLGFDLRSLLLRPPGDESTPALAERLNQTIVTQPALFAVEYALARQWIAWGVAPEAMIGHSVGEYVAATLAGVFTVEDALALVATRGRLIMGLPGGAMLSVRLAEAELAPLLTDAVSLAAVNGPTLCTVAGPHDAIASLEAELANRSVISKRVRTSHAFHSSMMDPILGAFEARVRQVPLSLPTLPFMSSVTGTWITATEATDPAYWARHVRCTVRFWQGAQELLRGGDRTLVEVGPGRSLSTLARQAGSKSAFPSMTDAGEAAGERAAALEAVARLWLSGATPDWLALHSGETRCRVSLPTYPFERRRFWVEPPALGAATTGVDPAPAPIPASDEPDLEVVLRGQLEILSQQLQVLTESNLEL
jgi:amino acid adenylation domain-containing protein